MKKTKCSKCGFTDWDTAVRCKRCGNASPADDDSAAETESKSPTDTPISDNPNNYWVPPQETVLSWISTRRNPILLWLAVLIIGVLLNQTYFVSKWFVPEDVAEILNRLDERTRYEENPVVLAARERVKTLTVHAARGRASAIKELVDLEITPASSGVIIDNPGTRKADDDNDRASMVLSDRPGEYNVTYAPHFTLESNDSYRNRKAVIGDFVDDILVHLGEPAVAPIMDVVRASYEKRKAGATDGSALMPRRLLEELGRIGSPRALDLLIACASIQPMNFDNIAAIDALSNYTVDDPRLLAIYDNALNEAKTPGDQSRPFKTGDAMRAAFLGLSTIHSRRALEILGSHLGDEYRYDGESQLVRAISSVGKPAIDPLRRVALDTSQSDLTRQRAIKVLGMLSAGEVTPDLTGFLDSAGLHKEAALALAAMNTPDVLPALEQAVLRHPEWRVDFSNAITMIKH